MVRYHIFFLLLCLTVPGLSAHANAIYSYQDNNGVIHYTNVRADGRARIKEGVRTLRYDNSSKSLSSYRPSGSRYTSKPVSMGMLNHYIKKAAARYRVDPFLIKAIIKAESDFNPRAVSSQGARGLMQLMPGTARDLKVTDPFDIKQNIDGGTRYFKRLLRTYDGNVKLSLAAYNAGPGRVKPHGAIPRIPETLAYVDKILKYYRAYRGGLAHLTSINIHQMVTVH